MTDQQREIEMEALLLKYYRKVFILETFIKTVIVKVNNSIINLNNNPNSRNSGDNLDFVEFLRTTLIATNPDASPISSFKNTGNHFSMKCLLDRVIRKKLNKASQSYVNILTSGQLKDGNIFLKAHLQEALESGFIRNNNIGNFLDKKWDVLLSTIGDEAMLYILENCSIFISLGHLCYLQISGAPITDLPIINDSRTKSYDRDVTKSCIRKLRVKKKHKPTKKSDNGFTKIVNAKSTSTRYGALKRSVDVTDAVEPAKKKARCEERSEVNDGVVNVDDSLFSSSGDNNFNASNTKNGSGMIDDEVNAPADDSSLFASDNANKSQIDNNLNAASDQNVKKRRRKRRKKKNSSTVEESQDFRAYDANVVIDKITILYCHVFTCSFPPKFALKDFEKRKPVDRSMIEKILLKRDIYLDPAMNKSSTLNYPESVWIVLEKSFEMLLKQHAKFKYKWVLESFLSGKMLQKRSRNRHRSKNGAIISSNTPLNSTKNAKKTSLVEKYVPAKKLELFLKVCINKVIPTELLGSEHNKETFCKSVRYLLYSGRFENLTLDQLMFKVKTKCGWMSEIRNNSERLQLLARLHYWLMSSYVMGLIRSYFFVTDSDIYKNKIFFYHKPVWKKICQKAISESQRRGLLKEISKELAESSVSSGKSLGFAKVRFTPKLSSVRMITNMKKKQNLNLRAINWQLDDVRHIILYERSLKPEIMGSSVLSINHTHNLWKKYFLNNYTADGLTNFFFVKTDIKSCFDSISHYKLYSILKRIFDEPKIYQLIKYNQIKLGSHTPYKNTVRAAVEKTVEPFNFKNYAQELVGKKSCMNTIFIDTFNYWQISTEMVLQRLKAHLLGNILQFNGSYYLQMQGISQGSCISSLLCNLYYADMEFKNFSVRSDELLLRQVDDYIFVSKDVERAKIILEKMSAGFVEYSFQINKEKTLTNFKYDAKNRGMCSGTFARSRLPWCGLIIDMKTLEIYSDYSKFAGLSVKYTMSASFSNHPGSAIEKKLLFSVRSKCNSIYFDTTYNSVNTIFLNVYKIFLLLAYKFVYLIRKLPMQNSLEKNKVFFFTVIQNVCIQVTSLLRICARKDKEIKKLLVYVLCLKAFEIKLNKQRAQFNSLLKLIKMELTKLFKIYKNIDFDVQPTYLTSASFIERKCFYEDLESLTSNIDLFPQEFNHILS
uniref:Telomerase reverse transcriptase n=1 Tax=Helobdella robusta TaxID=6412 RepID=J7SF03_HELRO|nr:TPA_inf: telomerase reverse transcriptase [Helobdella robusta]